MSKYNLKCPITVQDLLEENYSYGYSTTFSILHEYAFELRGIKLDLNRYQEDSTAYKAAFAAYTSLIMKIRNEYGIEDQSTLEELISKYYNVRAREVVYGS